VVGDPQFYDLLFPFPPSWDLFSLPLAGVLLLFFPSPSLGRLYVLFLFIDAGRFFSPLFFFMSASSPPLSRFMSSGFFPRRRLVLHRVGFSPPYRSGSSFFRSVAFFSPFFFFFFFFVDCFSLSPVSMVSKKNISGGSPSPSARSLAGGFFFVERDAALPPRDLFLFPASIFFFLDGFFFSLPV